MKTGRTDGSGTAGVVGFSGWGEAIWKFRVGLRPGRSGMEVRRPSSCPPEEPEPVAQTESPTVPAPRDTAGAAPAIVWLTGLLALASLIACAALPFVVYAAGVENHSGILTSFHRWLIVPTAVYFVAGTVFYNLRRGAKTP